MSRSETPATPAAIERATSGEYKYGFVTEIESDTVPPGLDADVVRLISARKNEPEWLLDWRLKALQVRRAFWYSPVAFCDLTYSIKPL